MNAPEPTGDAERVKAEGETIFNRLLPELKDKGIKAGTFVAINIATGQYVLGDTRGQLMSSYKTEFGHVVGWVRRVEYDGNQ